MKKVDEYLGVIDNVLIDRGEVKVILSQMMTDVIDEAVKRCMYAAYFSSPLDLGNGNVDAALEAIKKVSGQLKKEII
jgi:hypothetical protein